MVLVLVLVCRIYDKVLSHKTLITIITKLKGIAVIRGTITILTIKRSHLMARLM